MSLAAIPFLALALGACGQAKADAGRPEVASVTGKKEAADPKGATQAKLREYGDCMRAAGFNIPDPASRDAVETPPEASTNLEVRKKVSKCQQLLPPAELPKTDPGVLAEQNKIAKCMREHGVPEAQDRTETEVGGYVPPVDFTSKRFRDAHKACTGETLPASGQPVG